MNEKYSIAGQLINSFGEINTENNNKMFGIRSVDSLLSKIVEGHVYVATTRNRTLESNGVMNLLIKNPNGSGKTIIVGFIIDSEGKLDYKSYSGITVTASTPVTPLSLKIPKLRDPEFEVYNGVTYTGGTLRADDLLPLGNGGTARGGSSSNIYNPIEKS